MRRSAEIDNREPLVSVLLPTTHPWPALSESLQSVLAQARGPAFEVLILDGHGEGLQETPLDAAVRWIRLPGHDSFALRAAGIEQASGEILAITEDHCLVPQDWVASIVAAHRDDPSPAIVGAVRNHAQSATSAMDRANFLLTFAGQTPNRLNVRGGRLPVPTNVSFKRSALGTQRMEPGELEYRWLALQVRKRTLGVAESVQLEHKQSWGSAVFGVHFASGRSYGSSLRDASRLTRVKWWLRFPLVPLRLLRIVLPELLNGAAGREAGLADLCSVVALIAANVCGQLLGALLGPGSSRHRL